MEMCRGTINFMYNPSGMSARWNEEMSTDENDILFSLPTLPRIFLAQVTKISLVLPVN